MFRVATLDITSPDESAVANGISLPDQTSCGWFMGLFPLVLLPFVASPYRRIGISLRRTEPARIRWRRRFPDGPHLHTQARRRFADCPAPLKACQEKRFH